MKLNTVLPAVFNRMKPNSTFLAVKNYTNNYNEISNFGLVFNVDYINIVLKSLYIWNDIEAKNPLEKRALDELIRSYEDSLHGPNPRATATKAYERITDYNNKVIKGVKWFHEEEVHLSGLLVHKKIIKPGRIHVTKHGELASMKYRFKKLTPLSKWRQFSLTPDRFKSVDVQKLNLTQQDLIMELQPDGKDLYKTG